MNIDFRMACLKDAQIYFQWANDDLVRANSYEQRKISLEEHNDWFKRKLASPTCFFYFFSLNRIPTGQVRIDNSTTETIIGISVDSKFRGKGMGVRMLEMACEEYIMKFPLAKIIAYNKADNIPSYKVFKEAEFMNDQRIVFNGIESIKLSKIKK